MDHLPKNSIAIGPAMRALKDGDIVIGDAAGSFLRVSQSGSVYLNNGLIATDEKIHGSMRTAIGCCVALPPPYVETKTTQN